MILHRPFRPSKVPCATTRALSLIELLLVIALMAMLATFAAPAVSSLMRGNEITRAEQTLVQQFSLARQTAIARNRRVEVRLYKFDNPEALSSDSSFCALQTFVINEDNTAKPFARLAKLPASVVLNEAAANSSLLGLPDKAWTAQDPQISLPGIGTSYTAKAFQFRPDGSTGLASGTKWFVTLHAATAGASASSPPANFATIQMDPVSGGIRVYRP